MRGACRVQAAAARIGNMRFDGGDGELLHEVLGGLPPRLEAEADHAAAAVGQILACAIVFRVVFQSRIPNPADGGVLL